MPGPVGQHATGALTDQCVCCVNNPCGRALLRPSRPQESERGTRHPVLRCRRRGRFARVAHLAYIDSPGVSELLLIYRLLPDAPGPPPPGVLGRGAAEPKEKPERLPSAPRSVPRVHARGGLRALVQTVLIRSVLMSSSGAGVVRRSRLLGDRRPSGTAVRRMCATPTGSILSSRGSAKRSGSWAGFFPRGGKHRGRRRPWRTGPGDDRQSRVCGVIGQANDGEPSCTAVMWRAGRATVGGRPTRRVDDAEEPCPACGVTDWDEYSPFGEWRRGRGSKVEETHVESPVVSAVPGVRSRGAGGRVMRFSCPDNPEPIAR